MHKVTVPTVPLSLPNYLAEGLPKQDKETLRETREYLDKLLETCEQRRKEPFTEDELPGTAQILKDESNGAVYLEYQTSGDTVRHEYSGK
ncbi:hypothetical protein [Halalkalicoccus paucihalophilus]|uniref:hypothetical protein n=1 Tax=Halalkalicoccus paucihalophilus TaxID=1008153 RepID=UPI00082A80F5|nr:hypothetical protein [Halalkalicoccus paucihalophilus]